MVKAPFTKSDRKDAQSARPTTVSIRFGVNWLSTLQNQKLWQPWIISCLPWRTPNCWFLTKRESSRKRSTQRLLAYWSNRSLPPRKEGHEIQVSISPRFVNLLVALTSGSRCPKFDLVLERAIPP